MLIKTPREPHGSSRLYQLGPVPPGAARPLARVYESGHVEAIEYQTAAEVQEIIDSVSRIREVNNWRQHRPHEEGEPRGMLLARIPTTVYATWRRMWREHYRGEMTWDEFFTRMLNHRDFRRFNAMPGDGVIPLNPH